MYDLVQWVFGARAINSRLRPLMPALAEGSVVLDVGGGTGLNGSLRPSGCAYICLDPDPGKLAGFLKHGRGLAVLGGGDAMPFLDGCAGLAVCKFVAHHLDDAQLERLKSEVRRVLEPGGRFLFVEALATRRAAGRLLWRFDQGSHPRSPERLRAWLEDGFSVERWERFAVFHDYVAALAVPR